MRCLEIEWPRNPRTNCLRSAVPEIAALPPEYTPEEKRRGWGRNFWLRTKK
jgi:hypothetical protein